MISRRDALKVAGGLLAGTLAESVGGAASAATLRDSESGQIYIRMHGPSILRFPPNGKRAELHFTGISDSACPQPLHLPWLKINQATTRCTLEHHTDRYAWPIAGLSVEPRLDATFSAVDFDRRALAAGELKAFPTTVQDWRSLRWIRQLTPRVSRSKLEDATTASVIMTSGELGGTVPFYPAARTAFWIWTDEAHWTAVKGRKSALALEPQHAMTDRLLLTGSYGGSVTLRISSRVFSQTGVDMTFVPLQSGGPIHIEISAEPPEDHLQAERDKPLLLYCSYYDLAETPPAKPRRDLPYLAPDEFKMQPDMEKDISSALVAMGAADTTRMKAAALPGGDAGQGQPTPNPECGSMRVILE
jgi:hypothetical protein